MSYYCKRYLHDGPLDGNFLTVTIDAPHPVIEEITVGFSEPNQELGSYLPKINEPFDLYWKPKKGTNAT